MRPGRFSTEGFLGPDERLADVLARDDATVRGLHLSHGQLAEGLGTLLSAAEADPARSASIDGRFRVAVTVYKGFQICPWAADPRHRQCDAAGGPRFASLDWTIRNLRTGQQMRGPGLIEHLIGAHHFYEGIQSPYRVAPADLATLLDLV
jgi:hypothetical protein